MRIGHGYDVHRMVEGRKLMIGGVAIPFERGLEGYSDADVLLHALCDALLGAVCLGDIGVHFPDHDPRFKNISSIELLRTVRTMVEREGYVIGNIDVTIIAQEPKLSPYIPQMRTNIAQVLGVEGAQINIKATTTEGLGFAGRREGIASYAVVLVKQTE